MGISQVNDLNGSEIPHVCRVNPWLIFFSSESMAMATMAQDIRLTRRQKLLLILEESLATHGIIPQVEVVHNHTSI